MDELELLKSKWQEREQNLPSLSYNDIYKMLLKKSSSIVKWIFYISIAEIIFWTLLAFLVPDSNNQFIEGMGLKTIFVVVNIINYTVFAIFIFLFYKNHKAIQITDSAKELMANILKTRKTVKYLIFYNVGTAIVTIIAMNIFYYFNQETLIETLSEVSSVYDRMDPETVTQIFLVGQIIGGIILIGFILLFYRIIYGILLKRLYRNYKELQKIEV